MADLDAPPAGPATPLTAARDGRWLSLGPASRVLGVDPDTLRRWADHGRVAAWTTPGGHRRFERRALERMATERRHPGSGQPLASLGASPARLQRVYRQHYAHAPEGTTPAVSGDVAERDAYRRSGRMLVEALLAFLDARDDDAERARTEAAANAIVDDQAIRLATHGASLTEAVSLFVAARRPFLAEIAGLGRRRSLDPGRLAVLYEDATTLLDRLLMRFIVAHQATHRTP